MNRSFGTFAIRTQLALPALPAVGSLARGIIDLGWADAPIPTDIAWNHHWRDGDAVLLSLARHGANYWLRVPETADFLLQPSEAKVSVSPEARSLDAATLEHLLVDQVLPRLLAHGGALMVHASALSIAGRNVLFMGPSGWGKSTLAGILQGGDHEILSDDCVQLRAAGESFEAIPTYPSLRLNDDSATSLFPNAVATQPVAFYSNKRRIPVPSAPDDQPSRPVDALYLLGNPHDAGDVVKISPLTPLQACEALLRHTFRLDLADRAANARQLALCGAAARAIPCFRLDYPRDFNQAPGLVQAILEHLDHLPQTT